MWRDYLIFEELPDQLQWNTVCVCVHVKGSVKLSIFAVHLKHMTLTTHCYWGQAAGSWTVRRTEEGSAALFCPLVIRILKVLHGCKSETIPQIIDWNDSNPIWSQFVKKNELKKLNQKGSDLVLFSGTPIILVKLKSHWTKQQIIILK